MSNTPHSTMHHLVSGNAGDQQSASTKGSITMSEITKPEFAKGTWQHTLQQSSELEDRSAAAKKRSAALVWKGAVAAIEEWLPNSATDVSGEALYNSIKEAMGEAKRGTASKIKDVALAVKDKGLVLNTYPSLFKAYPAAKALLGSEEAAKEASAEDVAADEAITALAESAPKSSSTPEGAALIVLAQGVDEAAKILLDALNGPSGEQNLLAHRALVRAIAQEVAGRVPRPEPKPAKAATPKSGAKATKTAAKTAKPATAKGKPDPTKRALPPKAPVAEQSEPEPEQPVDDLDALLDEDSAPEQVETPEAPAPTKPAAKKAVPAGKGAPVRRR